MPKIEIPHPGTSYNPDYDDHQDLLLKAHVIELQRLQEEQKLMRKLTVSVKKMSWDQLEVSHQFGHSFISEHFFLLKANNLIN